MKFGPSRAFHPCPSAPLAAALACLVAAPAAAQITTLALEGDPVAGVGDVSTISGLSIGPNGETIVEIDTNNPDTDADNVVVIDGVIYQVEGQALLAPPATTLDTLDATFINSSGNIAQNLGFDGTGSIQDDSGVYWNDSLIAREGDVLSIAGLSMGTTYEGFFEVRINDAERLLALASVDDPNVNSSVDRALIFYDIDTNTGTASTQTLLYKESDVIPALAPEAITDFGTNPQELAYNQPGDVLYVVDLSGDAAFNSAVVLSTSGGDTVLAREGSPAPVMGRNWSGLTSISLDLNDSGSWILRGSLDGDSASNSIIVKDGAKLIQEGDGHPDIPVGMTFTSFGTGSVELDNAGNVVWFGDWNDPDTDIDTGLFYNDSLLVQEGVTTVGGLLIDDLFGVTDGFFLSPDGRSLLFEARLEGGLDGAFVYDITTKPFVYCEAKASSSGCLASISAPSFFQPVSGAGDYTIDVDSVQGDKNGILFFGLTGPTALPFQGGTLCVMPPLGRTPIQNSMGSGPTSCDGSYSLLVNDGASLFDSGPGNSTWFQTWYRDPGLMDGFDTGLSNGLQLTFE